MRSAIRAVLVFGMASLTMMGAGPCDVLDMLDDGAVHHDGDCPVEPCANRLDVRIIRADNESFWPGHYWFAIGLMDGGVYAVDCWLAHEESDFECDIGDTHVLRPLLEDQGAAIGLVVAGAPERLVVAVEYSGYLLGERELAPAYDEINPGGPGCPVCLEGRDSMAVTQW